MKLWFRKLGRSCLRLALHPVTWVVAGLLLATVILIWVPRYQVSLLQSYSITPEKVFELEDKARATLAQIIGGIVVLFSAYFTWRGLANSREAQEKQTEIALSERVTDRFIRAVDQLNAAGPENLTKRLGGIYALERIARESADDHGPVMEILAAFVRQNAPRTQDDVSKPRPPEDIQAVLTVIGRRDRSRREANRIDLSSTDLAKANLSGAYLPNVILSGSDLSEGVLNHACLRDADLSKANLSFADLIQVNMSRACLVGTDVTRAFMVNANLAEAVFARANLRWASIAGSHMVGANLWKADLSYTDMEGTLLAGASLKDTIGLTQRQVDEAITDGTTMVNPPLVVNCQETTEEPAAQE